MGDPRFSERKALGERESGTRREELVDWLGEVARQLETGTLLIDGQKVAVPEEVRSRLKTKDKKGRGSLELRLEWETKSPKEARKKGKKSERATFDDERRSEEESGAAAMVRDYDSHVLVCAGGDCKKRGSKGVRKALKDELRASGAFGDVRIDTVDCLGLCKHGPNAVVYDGAKPKGTWYLGLGKAGVSEVVDQHLKGCMPVERLAADRRLRKAKKLKG